MRTLTHIRHGATRAAVLGLLMAVFGLLAATWTGTMSLRDIACCGDDVCNDVEFGTIGMPPIVGGAATLPAMRIALREQSRPLVRVEAVHTAPHVDTAILLIAPKTSPPA